MQAADLSGILVENSLVPSKFLNREVKVDYYLPKNLEPSQPVSILLINDGQNMKELGLKTILETLYAGNIIHPIICVSIHAGLDRKMEYGTAIQSDYLGRGAKAGLYTLFITREILPLLNKKFDQFQIKDFSFAGFSLGGLMALDIVWNYPNEFNKVGVFSGSLWWRSVDYNNDKYVDELHKIMHQQIKKGKYRPGLKFYFTTGSFDETFDRNKNGIIDSIDDTLGLIDNLEVLGYKNELDIRYINYEDGRHDITTWARAMPEFLKWGWGK